MNGPMEYEETIICRGQIAELERLVIVQSGGEEQSRGEEQAGERSRQRPVDPNIQQQLVVPRSSSSHARSSHSTPLIQVPAGPRVW